MKSTIPKDSKSKSREGVTMSFGFSLQALEMSKSFLAPLLFGLHDLHDSRVRKKQKPARRNIGNKRKGPISNFPRILKSSKTNKNHWGPSQ